MSQTKPKNLNQALIQLAATVAGSVGYIEEQIIGITEGIIENNPQQIATAGHYTKNVRKLTAETIQKTLEAFVIYKPKGNDAKLILISWRIATALERISILLNDVAIQSDQLQLNDVSGAKTVFLNIHDALMSQTYNIVIAYTADRSDLIADIIEKELHIRNVYKSFFREMIIALIEDPKMISKIEKCLEIAKIFEMIAYYMHEISEHLTYKFNLNT
ncbi:MAG: phosphate transport system protein [Alphaproteobacteria bacterium]|jgi:phosphate transport system protein